MNQDIQNLIFPFPIKQAVLWGEMDAWNHINNVIYFRYFETGRVEFFNKTNLWKLFLDENVRIVVGKLECNYTKEIMHPADIEIAVAITKIGNSSLIVHHKVTNSNNEICAHGEGIIVGTNPATGKSIPWSENIRSEFEKWM